MTYTKHRSPIHLIFFITIIMIALTSCGGRTSTPEDTSPAVEPPPKDQVDDVGEDIQEEVFFWGFVSTQLIAVIQVILSNRNFYDIVSELHRSGYFVIPNTDTMPTLLSFKTAFFGGLFFTVSLGSALSIISIICAWICPVMQ